jgi:hypothetical protein
MAMEEQILDKNPASHEERIDYDAKCDKLIAEGFEFKTSEYINKGFDLFKENAGGFIGFTAIIILFNLIAGFIPFIGTLALIVIQPSLLAGFFIVGRKMVHNEPYEFGDFFKGFDFFLQLFIGNLVMGIFIIIGIILLIIPGIFFAVAYMWAFMFIVFAGKEFWPAMEMSRKVIGKNWFSFFGFIIIIVLINIVGLLALGIGLLVTWPATMLALFVSFNSIASTNKGE